MSFAMQSSKALLAILLAVSVSGCEEPKHEEAKPKASAKPAPSVAAPAPTKSAEPPKDRDDCPEGTKGPGTFDLPCKATGDARMMKVKWTGKIEDKGPKFEIVSKSELPILYGSLHAYFYDKAGKQLEVPGDKKAMSQPCAGRIFAGVVKPGEKIYMFFSCVQKKHVPEGAVAIEAEVDLVGFADESGKRSEFYWSNKELVPSERPKGGVQAKDKKK